MAIFTLLSSSDKPLRAPEQALADALRAGVPADVLSQRGSDWESLYYLSPMRRSLLNWYPFSPDSTLLEVGCEMGTLTSLFCEKCRRVVALDDRPALAQATAARLADRGNLEVLCGCCEDLLPRELRFDCIVLMPAGYGSQLDRALQAARRLLKEDGVVLLCVRNRLGTDAWAGNVCPGEVPFASRNRADSGFYTREQLDQLVRQTGFDGCKYYYPAPDHIFTQEIYTEESIPAKSDTARVLHYYPSPDTLVFSPAQAQEDVLRNGIFTACANTFLLECRLSADARPAPVRYAALSTDREHTAAYATVLQDDETVRKQALYPEGRQGLAALCRHHAELADRGLPVLPLTLNADGTAVTMPCVHAPVLADLLLQNAADPNRLTAWLDRLQEMILRSAPLAEARDNALLSPAPQADWGPILRKAYIDMIPLNIFWVEGEFLFFDQEFCCENYPARYILFRALRYTALAFADHGLAFDLANYRQRYHLTALWDIFLQEEDRFIIRNRNRAANSAFYRLTELSPETLHRNVERLQHGVTEDFSSREAWENDTVEVGFSQAFYGRETDGTNTWYWCHEDLARLVVLPRAGSPRRGELEFEILMADEHDHCKLDVQINGAHWGSFFTPIRITLPLACEPDQRIEITLSGHFAPRTFPGDSRTFRFQFRNHRFRAEPAYADPRTCQIRTQQLALLSALQEVCRAHRLRYFAFYGTLLGAVRHGGYVPWDDDVDIVMPRRDYNALLALVREGKALPHCFWQNMHTDSHVFFGAYSRLCNRPPVREKLTDEAVWLDILPLDAYPYDQAEATEHCRKLYGLYKQLYHKAYDASGQPFTRFAREEAVCEAVRGKDWDELCRQLEETLQRYEGSQRALWAVTARILPRDLHIATFDPVCFLGEEQRPFASLTLPVPTLYDEVLRSCYGYLYMMYPEPQDRRPAHTL